MFKYKTSLSQTKFKDIWLYNNEKAQFIYDTITRYSISTDTLLASTEDIH